MSKTTSRRSPRYSLRTEGREVVLSCKTDTWLGEEGTERHFAIRGRYVYEVSPETEKGRQVCDRLSGSGSTLMWSNDDTLIDCIRYEAQACLREEEKDAQKRGWY